MTRAISDIRDDFETLFQSQLQELEEYYRIKTEEIQEEIARDNERKRVVSEEAEENTLSSMLSSWTELNDEFKQLKEDNNQLETDFNDTLADLNRIREEQAREHEKIDVDVFQLQQEYQDKQNIVNGILDNNVSLRFELLTYRNLLKSEEKRIQRDDQEQQSQTSSSLPPPPPPPATDSPKGYTVQKLAVKKTSKGLSFLPIMLCLFAFACCLGPIIFDTIDFVNDCVIIYYDASTGENQSLDKWTIHRQNDQQTELVYQFPSTCSLKPQEKIRILSKRSPEKLRAEKDVLIADQIETWSHGQRMITRLFDDQNEDRATITETRLPI